MLKFFCAHSHRYYDVLFFIYIFSTLLQHINYCFILIEFNAKKFALVGFKTILFWFHFHSFLWRSWWFFLFLNLCSSWWMFKFSLFFHIIYCELFCCLFKHFQYFKNAITFMKVSDIVPFPFFCCPHPISFWFLHGYCYWLCFVHILHYFVHWCQVQKIFFETIMESLSFFLSYSISFHH
jgi:hypothetical protein